MSLKFHKIRSSRELISFTEIFEIGTSECTAPVVNNLSLKNICNIHLTAVQLETSVLTDAVCIKGIEGHVTEQIVLDHTTLGTFFSSQLSHGFLSPREDLWLCSKKPVSVGTVSAFLLAEVEGHYSGVMRLSSCSVGNKK